MSVKDPPSVQNLLQLIFNSWRLEKSNYHSQPCLAKNRLGWHGQMIMLLRDKDNFFPDSISRTCSDLKRWENYGSQTSASISPESSELWSIVLASHLTIVQPKKIRRKRKLTSDRILTICRFCICPHQSMW